ncbi:MAG: alanine--tRNA ligase-related protein [Candidatus Paceibacterota bacterium]|jgi:alanyl-tRNA synthetase
MNGNEIRKNYLEYFGSRKHAVIPSAPIIPENDPTTLFTSSGMQPLIPYLLGSPHPRGVRLVNSQKCFRAEDIEEVGDNRHTTCFEMLGNWSLGDYFKKEQLGWFFNFLTEVAKLQPEKLYVTVFAGEEKYGIPRDDESVEIWKELFKSVGVIANDVLIGSEENGGKVGMQSGRIFYYNSRKNWWSRSGVPENMPTGEPGGPDSEVFYDFGTPHDKKFGENCHPNCDCGRFMEIGNSVFMEYLKMDDGSFSSLPQKNVDFGGGLERITAASMDSADIFSTDLFSLIIDFIEKLSGKKYEGGKVKTDSYFRIVADHIKGAVFMMSGGILPSNTEQGYVLRRLVRRAVRYTDELGIKPNELQKIVDSVALTYKEAYPEIIENIDHIRDGIKNEEAKFRKTLEVGMRQFEKRKVSSEQKPKDSPVFRHRSDAMSTNTRSRRSSLDEIKNSTISGHEAFLLFTTHGFPIELTLELAKEKELTVDIDGFKEEMEKHKALSRSQSDQKFKGGLADHGEMAVKYHTATHLLQKALRDVLGEHVFQKGSNITGERLRFDFSHNQKMTDEEKQKVENLVNQKIAEGLPVSYEDVPLEEAEKRGAIRLFEEKYGDIVRVYKIGDFSLEFCGGPHVSNTSELGNFKISKEEAVSSGVRRIKAILT